MATDPDPPVGEPTLIDDNALASFRVEVAESTASYPSFMSEGPASLAPSFDPLTEIPGEEAPLELAPTVADNAVVGITKPLVIAQSTLPKFSYIFFSE